MVATAERAPSVQRLDLRPGVAGIDQSVEAMAKLALGAWGARSIAIRDLALSIIRDARAPERDQLAQVHAVHAWIQAHCLYVFDPVGAEYVQTPTEMLRTLAGDCDDFSTLEAAMLGALGIRTRFVVVAFNAAGAFSHVYLQAEVRAPNTPQRGWLNLDPIAKDKPIGWSAPNTTRRKVYPVNDADGFPADPSNALGLLAFALIGELWRRL